MQAKIYQVTTMSSAFVLNRENALKLADLMSLLPQDIANEIHEFNADHAEKWRQVMSSALRHVNCPSYFHAAEEEIYWHRITHEWTVDELEFKFRCERCGVGKKDAETLLAELKWQRRTAVLGTMAICGACFEEHFDDELEGEPEWDDFDPNVDFDFNYDIDESDFDP